MGYFSVFVCFTIIMELRIMGINILKNNQLTQSFFLGLLLFTMLSWSFAVTFKITLSKSKHDTAGIMYCVDQNCL